MLKVTQAENQLENNQTHSLSLFAKICQKTLGESKFLLLQEIGNSDEVIYKWQGKRILQAVLVAMILGVILFFLMKDFLVIGAVIGFGVIYSMKGRSLNGIVRVWRFQRHLAFIKFVRLVVPHFYENNGRNSLYSIFNKVVTRLDAEEDKKQLFKLMTEMSAKPNDITPFLEFGKKMSGSDISVLIMTSFYDYTQNGFDATSIEGLAKLANEEMLEGVDEIITFKLRKFVFFPTKVVMVTFLIVLGYAVGLILYNLTGEDSLLKGIF